MSERRLDRTRDISSCFSYFILDIIYVLFLVRNVRELASQALHNLTPADPEYMAKTGNTRIKGPVI